MIQKRSMLTVADNTGVKKVMCIQSLGKRKDYAEVGEIIVASVKDATPDAVIKKGEVVKAVIVRTLNKLHVKMELI
jgi:large subunit ribosomal protein L14